MPANVPPQYIRAEAEYKQARTVEEKIAALEEMWALLPKHKGTDKLQADIKRRLSKLRTQPPEKRRRSRIDPFHVPPAGAGQTVLVGLPNSGKSALVAALTRAKLTVADYPYATQLPGPGMAPWEDVKLQLVDLPPIADDGAVPAGMMGTIRAADILLLIADGSADPVAQLDRILGVLADRGVVCFSTSVEGRDEQGNLCKRTLVACSKSDLVDVQEVIPVLNELYADRLKVIPVSAVTGGNLDKLKLEVFKLLDVVRVYAKVPGKAADLGEPFVLKRGSTVLEMARQVHRDLPEKLKFARIWGSEKFDGQPVQRDYVLQDKDIIELHS